MKIFSIVVCTFKPEKKIISSSVDVGFLRSNPHEEYIRQSMENVTELYGLHSLKTADAYYYALVEKKKIIAIAVDEKLKHENLKVLFDHIDSALTPQSLTTIIKNPEDYVRSTIDKINDTIADVNEIMRDNIEKILERGEKIESILMKTEILVKESALMKQKSIDLKRHMRCPTLFGMYRAVRDFIWGDQEYEYEAPANRRPH